MPPVRVCSDATGTGAVASFTFSNDCGVALPILLTGQADSRLWDLAKSSVVAAHRLQSGLEVGKLILFVDKKAACAAVTKGGAKVHIGLASPYSLWATASRRGLSI